MKDIKSTLLERRSIRRYEREDIPAESLDFIYEAIRNTPTSYNGQQFSVIDVDDQSVKEKIYELTGQKQVKTCRHFFLFCADYNKITEIAEAKSIELPGFPLTADGVIVGVVDATLAMMNALTAAEACGLGTCPIGYARTAAPDAIARLMKLPPKVFVVCGLAIGVPREMPDIKPKQPKELMIFKNRYREDSMLPDLMAYDKEITKYNATRSGTKTDNDWAEHIISYYREAMSYNTLDALRRRGFDVRF
ncbi:NADPH-dependent oxidoreductase [Barnesiella sp. WM24]|uniref:nitroreductase family protein n=1 Tax=Barnesiella sp. WM24 TaxID=2558278 RepID=UPI001071E22F|nr:nitroreductase family protein [Barnesiella sp. WM24]TFU92808.1 NADPH-dependent oxidoreductase [Barnesiella sp. WM24]